MKHTKQVCRCEAYRFPHRRDIKRCVVYEDVDQEREDRLNDPRRGQADAENRMEAIYRSGRGQR